MKPLLRCSYAILALIMMTAIAAKGTTVTGTTISSGDGQLLTNAKITAEFVPKPGTSGSPVITSVTATTDINGSFTMTLTDVNTISPSGGTWRFTVCPNATVPCTVIPGVVITGTTQEIGGLITTNIPILSVTAQTLVPKAYNDNEIPVIDLSNTGALYWNTADKTLHLWDGTVWSAFLSASGNNNLIGNNNLTGNNNLSGNNIFTGNDNFLKGISLTGGLLSSLLPTPSAPVVIATGTGATTYSYQVTYRDLSGESIGSSSTSVTNGATLSLTVFNTIATVATQGAQSCAVYRTAGGINQGFIGSVTCGNSLIDTGLNSCTGSCSSPYIAPTQNTTGGVNSRLPLTIFMGDSRTRGITFTLTNLFPNQPWINRGRGGDKCADEDARFAAEVVAFHPAAVFINCGTNDFWNTTGTPAAGSVFTAAENAVTDMVLQSLAAGIAPILSTVPPVRPGVSQPIVAQMNTDLITFNTWIKGFTAPYGGVRIIDLYGAVVDATGQLPLEITVDGVHFNDTVGNPLLAGFIRSYLPNPGTGTTYFGERSILNASQLNGGWCIYNVGAPNLANYEKGCFVVNSNGYDLTAVSNGTGVLRPIRLKGSFVSLGTPSVTWWLGDGSNLRPAADNTYDLGVVATNRIKRTYTLQLNSGQAANSDLDGTLTAVANSVTLTFAGVYVSHPICIASDETTATAAVKVTYGGVTAVTFTTPGATDVIDYICHGRN